MDRKKLSNPEDIQESRFVHAYLTRFPAKEKERLIFAVLLAAYN